MEGIIAERDGKLFVVYTTTEDSNPVRVRMWWGIERADRNPYNAERPIAGDSVKNVGGGHWHASREGVFNTGSVWFPGSKPAEFIDREPIACPKTRAREVRYERGAWHKLTKKDWVAL